MSKYRLTAWYAVGDAGMRPKGVWKTIGEYTPDTPIDKILEDGFACKSKTLRITIPDKAFREMSIRVATSAHVDDTAR